nr:hypothetical protein [Burkholderia ubonensis]
MTTIIMSLIRFNPLAYLKDVLTTLADPQGQRHRRATAASLAAFLDRRLKSLVKTSWLAAYCCPQSTR